jgi:hypothetical protein
VRFSPWYTHSASRSAILDTYGLSRAHLRKGKEAVPWLRGAKHLMDKQSSNQDAQPPYHTETDTLCRCVLVHVHTERFALGHMLDTYELGRPRLVEGKKEGKEGRCCRQDDDRGRLQVHQLSIAQSTITM